MLKPCIARIKNPLLKKMRLLAILPAAVVCLSGNVSPLLAGDLELPENTPSFLEQTLEMFDQVAQDINDNLPDIDEFKEQMASFKSTMDAKISDVLDGTAGIIKGFSEKVGDLAQSSNEAIGDFKDFAGGLWGMIGEFPRWSEVESIAKPVVDNFVDDIKQALPAPRSGASDGNPLDGVLNFYDDMKSTNAVDAGELFSRESLALETAGVSISEESREETIAGIESTETVFREETGFRGDELVFHEIIVDDNVVDRFEETKDISFYHEALDEAEKDAADNDLIQYLGEKINLLNFEIDKAFKEDNLVVDIDHPQLEFPQGYSPNTFVDNLIQIINNIAQKI